MSQSTHSSEMTSSKALLGSPIVWGTLASAAFYGLIHSGLLAGEYVQAYFASHPVEYVATTMFFVGLAALLLKGVNVLTQRADLRKPVFGAVSRDGEVDDDCRALLQRLDRLPRRRQHEYLVCRLREAIEHVRRRGSAAGLDEHLKYLADLDAGRLHGSYALVRVIIWAIPILGFLGTVIGITLAIANLSPSAVEDSMPQVVQGLSVAFGTTTQALALSIILMFAQYYANQKESSLLDQVDQRVGAELEGRFEEIPTGIDGQLVAVRRMAETVLQASDRLVQRQAQLWQVSMEKADARWAQMADAAGRQLQSTLSGALAESVTAHARELAAAEEATAGQNQQHWQKVRQSQVEGTQAILSLQEAMARQAEVLGAAVQAAGEVRQLEETLNRNLATLAGAKHFEQTVMSLAAAIQLLSARLAEDSGETSAVELGRVA